MNIKSRFFVILLVLGVSFLLIWPNIGIRTLIVRFDDELTTEQKKQSVENLTSYLSKNYKDRYTWEIKNESVTPKKTPEEISNLLKNGIQDDLKNKVSQKNEVIHIYGRFIQMAFINELTRISGVDAKRTEMTPMWIEKNLKSKLFKLGLDLQGGMNLVLEGDFEKLKKI